MENKIKLCLQVNILKNRVRWKRFSNLLVESDINRVEPLNFATVLLVIEYRM